MWAMVKAVRLVFLLFDGPFLPSTTLKYEAKKHQHLSSHLWFNMFPLYCASTFAEQLHDKPNQTSRFKNKKGHRTTQ